MGLVVPSRCADSRALALGFPFGRRSPCPAIILSIQHCFLKFPMPAINTNNSRNAMALGSLTWSLTSLLRTLIHPYHYFGIVTLIASSFVLRHVIQIWGAFPPSKFYSPRPRPALSASPSTPLLAHILSSVNITCTTPCII